MPSDPTNEASPIGGEVKGLAALLRANGPLRRGIGLSSGVLGFGLSVLSLLGVLAFHFPAHLTTPELRASYDVQLLRHVLGVALFVAGSVSLVNLVLGRSRWLAAWSFAFVAFALALGGPRVRVGDFAEGTPYLGLDFFILDLLGSTVLFVFVEKLFGLRKAQPIFRPDWQNDLTHFALNHLSVGVALLVINQALFALAPLSAHASQWAVWSNWSLLAQVPLAVLVADLAQYWMHRAYHEVPALWRVHAVHHSVKHMDWLAGSRLHPLELLATRLVVLVPLYVCGFSKAAIDAYILFAGFQTVFNHANVSVRLGPLSYVLVTPNFHHWHHSRDDVAIDRNYAAHYAFLDHLFGTAVRAERAWPIDYGVVGDYVPSGYAGQVAFPFVGPPVSKRAEVAGIPLWQGVADGCASRGFAPAAGPTMASIALDSTDSAGWHGFPAVPGEIRGRRAYFTQQKLPVWPAGTRRSSEHEEPVRGVGAIGGACPGRCRV